MATSQGNDTDSLPFCDSLFRGCRKSLIITHKSGRLRAHPFAQFVIAAQAAIQWRVRAFYICDICDICAAQAQQNVFISQKKSALD
ncbi:hypothetical protein [Undibacterium sp. CCC3.4]|uniref:hypothetical protein n=1 Tax=Undibacterium sp. CCC3.4 TaxID=3048609 RepID=UPI002AC9DB2A|nr:hypothetical protein [Undibacterium sp. CCC3.4]WPX43459.1 hypothetical protein RHM61_19140 [Undibacterium sp. CCC3.4]